METLWVNKEHLRSDAKTGITVNLSRDVQVVKLADVEARVSEVNNLVTSALCWLSEGPDYMTTNDVLTHVKKDVLAIYAIVANTQATEPPKE